MKHASTCMFVTCTCLACWLKLGTITRSQLYFLLELRYYCPWSGDKEKWGSHTCYHGLKLQCFILEIKWKYGSQSKINLKNLMTVQQMEQTCTCALRSESFWVQKGLTPRPLGLQPKCTIAKAVQCLSRGSGCAFWDCHPVQLCREHLNAEPQSSSLTESALTA